MRTAFINELLAQADRRDDVHLLVGDLGYSVVEPFVERHGRRFLNVGVAEQNLAGVAAGLALSGRRTVFIYSLANFPLLRCLEQVRNDICYSGANVKIVAVGGGLAYGPQGYTHFAVEDLAIARALPGMVVTAAADAVEAQRLVQLACETPGPWYLRLGKNAEPAVHARGTLAGWGVGEAIKVRSGGDAAVLATGAIVSEACVAADALAREGIDTAVWSVPFVKPVDREAILAVAERVSAVVTVEEHTGHGGLGSVVAEVLAEEGLARPLRRLHTREAWQEVGSQAHLRRWHGLDAVSIAAAVRDLVPATCPPTR